MKRFYHYVKPNANSETLQHCVFVDTETDEVRVDQKYTGHRLRFGWAAHTRRSPKGTWSKPDWKRFTTLEEFWLWVMHWTGAKRKLWIWCHNSSFDYPVLDAFRHLPEVGWRMVSAIIDAPPTIVRYRSGSKTLVLCDTLNIWRMSLKELGAKVGLEKLEMPGKWTGGPDDDRYCKRDVEIILRAVTQWSDFLRDNDMGGFCPTIAAQSMRSYRHRWMATKILIDANPLACDLARKCFHGGRVEAGCIGAIKGPIYSLDVNSMYPFVMSYAEMPVRLKGVTHRTLVVNLPAILQKYCVCAHVRIETDEPAFAVVIDGKLCFPVGKFDAYLTSPEIEYALQRGYIAEIHLCASYEKEIAFKGFALDLYEHKERATRDGNMIEARHWKLLLNSFYGKWGQSGRHWVKVGTCEPHLFRRRLDRNAQTRKNTVFRDFGGFTFVRSEDGECLESHPAIAAHITAHARMVLWTLIGQLPPQDYLYCDTDGLLVTANGFKVLSDRIEQFALGGVKHVKTYSEVLINGCKDLVLDGNQVLKGIRPTAVKLNENEFVQTKWDGLKTLIGANSLFMPRTSMVHKLLKRTYDKGVVGPTGLVTPLHLDGPPKDKERGYTMSDVVSG